MNNIILFMLLLLIQPLTSEAQSDGKTFRVDAVTSSIAAALSSFRRSDIPNDSISGSCSFNGGSCNGAEVALYLNNQQVYATTLTSLGAFKIPNLKVKQSYVLKLTMKRHGLSETKNVNTGEFVEITLK